MGRRDAKRCLAPELKGMTHSKLLHPISIAVLVVLSAAAFAVSVPAPESKDSSKVIRYLDKFACRMDVATKLFADSSEMQVDQFIRLNSDQFHSRENFLTEVGDAEVTIQFFEVTDQEVNARPNSLIGASVTVKLNPQATFWPSVYKRMNVLLNESEPTQSRELLFTDKSKTDYSLRIVCEKREIRRPSSVPSTEKLDREDLMGLNSKNLNSTHSESPAYRPTREEMRFIRNFYIGFAQLCDRSVTDGVLDFSSAELKEAYGERVSCQTQFVNKEYALNYARMAKSEKNRCVTDKSAQILKERFSAGLVSAMEGPAAKIVGLIEEARILASRIYQNKHKPDNCELSQEEINTCSRLWDKNFAKAIEASAVMVCMDGLAVNDDQRMNAFENLFYLNCHGAVLLARAQGRDPLSEETLDPVAQNFHYNVSVLCP